jgi:GGDEF domain-containing protein
MTSQAKIKSVDLDQREYHFSLFVCLAIIVLAGGLALLMYPAVFSNREASPFATSKVAFFGFCTLACLLVAYIANRQITVQRLRSQIAADRKRASEALEQASADVLGTMPNFATFEDRLAMEFRRALVADLKLSVLVVAIHLSVNLSDSSHGTAAQGDAAKAISRKLREQDSIYILSPGYFGVILPGADREAAQRVSARLAEGLSDAAGASDRYSFKIHSISYPEQTSSAHDLELVVCGWLPTGDSKRDPEKAALVYE